jgi:hypothetical protein
MGDRGVTRCIWQWRFQGFWNASLREDGLFAKAILEHPGLSLDPEHRDPQGRTMLLSACRSALGADAALENSICDVSWNAHKGG